VDASARQQRKRKNTFAVTLLRASFENVLQEKTSTTFINVDHVHSTTIAAGIRKRQSIFTILERLGGYLTVYVAALFRAAAMLSIAIHTFESLTAKHCNSIFTPLFPESCPAA
jgi:hypothetical protein